jgi:hypothetical protein
MNLGQNHLVGPLPLEMKTLTRLTSLELDSNSLTGHFPTDIGLLQALVKLDVSLNRFTGPIPSEIGMLGKLKYLYLSFNLFTGLVPAEICDAHALQFLYICQSSIGCPWLQGIPECLCTMIIAKQTGDLEYYTVTAAPTTPHIATTAQQKSSSEDDVNFGTLITVSACLCATCCGYAAWMYGKKSREIRLYMQGAYLRVYGMLSSLWPRRLAEEDDDDSLSRDADSFSEVNEDHALDVDTVAVSV